MVKCMLKLMFCLVVIAVAFELVECKGGFFRSFYNLASQKQSKSCNLAYDFTPVCASNGITYINLSGLNCAAKDIPGLTLKKSGQCS
ncbi:hypothetical protein CHUAL_007670 [Chamberlinius hualienensis]